MITPFATASSTLCALIRRRRNFSVCVNETTYAPRSMRSRMTASRDPTSFVRFGGTCLLPFARQPDRDDGTRRASGFHAAHLAYIRNDISGPDGARDVSLSERYWKPDTERYPPRPMSTRTRRSTRIATARCGP